MIEQRCLFIGQLACDHLIEQRVQYLTDAYARAEAAVEQIDAADSELTQAVAFIGGDDTVDLIRDSRKITELFFAQVR